MILLARIIPLYQQNENCFTKIITCNQEIMAHWYYTYHVSKVFLEANKILLVSASWMNKEILSGIQIILNPKSTRLYLDREYVSSSSWWCLGLPILCSWAIQVFALNASLFLWWHNQWIKILNKWRKW